MKKLKMTAAALVALAVAGGTSVASADQAFHTLHASLSPVGSAPLHSGFVNDIHTNGPVWAAHERYQLNGALPGATFQVTIFVWPFNPSCTGAAGLSVASSQFTTNSAGNGEGSADFPAGPPFPIAPPGWGIQWQLSLAGGGPVVYQTGCNQVTND